MRLRTPDGAGQRQHPVTPRVERSSSVSLQPPGPRGGADTADPILVTNRLTARSREDVDVEVTGVGGSRLAERRAALAAVGKQPPPEVGVLR